MLQTVTEPIGSVKAKSGHADSVSGRRDRRCPGEIAGNTARRFSLGRAAKTVPPGISGRRSRLSQGTLDKVFV